jgi:hypothetical protein
MLSEAQKSGFWEDGVVVVDSAYSPNELEPLRVQHRRWIDESRQHDGPFGEMLDGRPRFDVEPRHSASAPTLRWLYVERAEGVKAGQVTTYRFRSRLVCQEQAHWRVLQQVPGHPAENDFAQPRVTVSTHDDQVRVHVRGLVDDRVADVQIGVADTTGNGFDAM